MKVYIINKSLKIEKIINEHVNLSRRINNLFLNDRYKDKWIVFSDNQINLTYSLRKYLSVSNDMVVYKDLVAILYKNWHFLDNFYLKSFNQVKNYLKKINGYTKFTNEEIDKDFNYLNEDDFLNNATVIYTPKKSINFYGFWNENGMPNRGPIIQTKLKEKYFSRDISKYNIHLKNFVKDPTWSHTLDPKNKENCSIGPNINLKKPMPSFYKKCNIVADSYWMKDYLIEKYNIEESKIFVIPIYVDDIFYNTKINQNKKFTIGVIGYYSNDDIKNIDSLLKICPKFPDINFEMLSSRNKSKFPKKIQKLPNLHFYNVPHENIIDRMKTWHGYIGMSKRERGPAALQELKVLGIPTICPLHTGYKEFNPLIGLNIEPYKSHNESDINQYVNAINSLQNNFDYYFELAQIEKERFWREEKSSQKISKLWETFFTFCLGEK